MANISCFVFCMLEDYFVLSNTSAKAESLRCNYLSSEIHFPYQRRGGTEEERRDGGGGGGEG